MLSYDLPASYSKSAVFNFYLCLESFLYFFKLFTLIKFPSADRNTCSIGSDRLHLFELMSSPTSRLKQI